MWCQAVEATPVFLQGERSFKVDMPLHPHNEESSSLRYYGSQSPGGCAKSTERNVLFPHAPGSWYTKVLLLTGNHIKSAGSQDQAGRTAVITGFSKQQYKGHIEIRNSIKYKNRMTQLQQAWKGAHSSKIGVCLSHPTKRAKVSLAPWSRPILPIPGWAARKTCHPHFQHIYSYFLPDNK
jgi:hypothetical protein